MASTLPTAAFERICNHCATSSTALWRRDSSDLYPPTTIDTTSGTSRANNEPFQKVLCNNCYLYQLLRGHPRPLRSKINNTTKDVVVAHPNSEPVFINTYLVQHDDFSSDSTFPIAIEFASFIQTSDNNDEGGAITIRHYFVRREDQEELVPLERIRFVRIEWPGAESKDDGEETVETEETVHKQVLEFIARNRASREELRWRRARWIAERDAKEAVGDDVQSFQITTR